MRASILICGEPERGAGSRHTQRVKAPGAMRPEGLGRKPISTRVAYGLRKSPGYRLCVGRAGGRVSRFFLFRGGTGVAITNNPPAINSFGAFKALRSLSSFPLVHDANQPTRGFTVFFRPAPSVRVALHERQSNQGWTACLTKGFPSPEKEFPRKV